MSKEDKLILGTLAGVDLVLSPEHYEEYKGTLNKQLEQKDKEIDRLNNIINRIDNFVDRTIEVIKQQPSENDEWILERLNGIKYLTELKENNK